MRRAALALVLVLALPATARARSFAIDDFAVAVDIQPDGSLAVQEALTVAFRGAHQGIFRTIPVRETRRGVEFVLRVDDIHVLDDNHQPLRTEVSYPGHYVQIKAWVPGAVDTVKTVRIVYRVQRGLLAFDDHDELYWNVTGTEWDVPIGRAAVTVTLPSGVALAGIQSVAYTGPRGAAGTNWKEERRERAVTFETTSPLRPREGLTIVVGWPTGAVGRPSTLRMAGWFLVDNWPLTLPALTLVLMGFVWRAYGRDPASNQSIKPEYEPPDGMLPAQAGALIDERTEPRDVVATLVDVAVRGYVHITRPEGDRSNFLFRRVKPMAGDSGIKPLERVMLRKVFGENLSLNERSLSELRRNYDYVFTPIRDAIDQAMVRDGFFAASPFWVRQGWGILGGAVTAVGVSLGAFLTKPGTIVPSFWTLPVGLILSGLVIVAFARLMPRRTLRGVAALVRVRGFQEFLERAEKDQLERLPADTLHRWLPWAIALGVTERWIHNWQGLSVGEPTWYESHEPFSLSTYHDDLRTFSHGNEEALLTSRRSGDSWSGGSGFSSDSGSSDSGGSSGGGSGGGGGGTF